MSTRSSSWEKWLAIFVVILFFATLYWSMEMGESWQTKLSLVGVRGRMNYPLHSRFDSGEYVTMPSDARSRPKEPERVAICMVGGLRAFELTGPTIKRYLLDVYEDADLFVHAPADADANKLSVLDGVPRLAALRIFKPDRINETRVLKELLTSSGSPNGIQGLLQYFRLVEGCLTMIENHEAFRGFKYDWIVRIRADSYWNAPMPPIASFNASKYYVPFGSNFGGLNDRLGVGTRETSRRAMARLSLLPQIYARGHRGLNSETAFKLQFSSSAGAVGRVPVELNTFPFCVLSLRRYAFPGGVAVMSIESQGPLNGAKCRPCTPKLVGKQAWLALADMDERAQIGPTEDPRLCDARGGWERHWERVFDEVSGPEMAEVRKHIESRSVPECVRELRVFLDKWERRDSPTPEALCASGNTIPI